MVKAHSGRIYLQKKVKEGETSLSESGGKSANWTWRVQESGSRRGRFWDVESQGYKVET